MEIHKRTFKIRENICGYQRYFPFNPPGIHWEYLRRDSLAFQLNECSMTRRGMSFSKLSCPRHASSVVPLTPDYFMGSLKKNAQYMKYFGDLSSFKGCRMQLIGFSSNFWINESCPTTNNCRHIFLIWSGKPSFLKRLNTFWTGWSNNVSVTSFSQGGVMVKAMDCGIRVSEFVLQSRYYVHFRTNTLGKSMNLLFLPVMGSIVPLLFFKENNFGIK